MEKVLGCFSLFLVELKTMATFLRFNLEFLIQGLNGSMLHLINWTWETDNQTTLSFLFLFTNETKNL